MTLDLLRFATAGSVDDGKSTLIGRLLYDTKQVFDDQLEHVERGRAARRRRRARPGAAHRRPARRARAGHHDRRRLPLLRDRRSARASSSPTARAIAVHAQHGHRRLDRRPRGRSCSTRARAWSSRRAATPSSARCSASRHVVVAVNKMDLVDYSQAALRRDRRGVRRASPSSSAPVPTSPTSRSRRCTATTSSSARRSMPWYAGPTLLEHLESVEVAYDHPHEIPARFPVQWVIRPGAGRSERIARRRRPDYRGYAGQVASGRCAPATRSSCCPAAGARGSPAIDTFDGELEEAIAPLSVTLRLEDELDVARGELIAAREDAPDGRARARGRPLLDDRAAAARRRALPAQAHHARRGRGRGPTRCDRVDIAHARAAAGARAARAQRHRPGAPAHERAAASSTPTRATGAPAASS